MSAFDGRRCACIVAIVGCFIYRESHCQVIVTLSPRQTADNGSTTTLNCSYRIMDSSYSFFDLEWRKGDSISNSFRIADFQPYLHEAMYFFNYRPPRFVALRDNVTNSGTLDIAQVNFADDEGLYWCRVTVLSVDSVDARDFKSAHLTVIVLPSDIALSDSTSGLLSAGSTLRVLPGEQHRLTCLVPDINPGARFEWTVGSRVVGQDVTSSDGIGLDGLTTSESNATLSFSTESHGMVLECRAINKDGHSGIAVGVTLYVKVNILYTVTFAVKILDPDLL